MVISLVSFHLGCKLKGFDVVLSLSERFAEMVYVTICIILCAFDFNCLLTSDEYIPFGCRVNKKKHFCEESILFRANCKSQERFE